MISRCGTISVIASLLALWATTGGAAEQSANPSSSALTLDQAIDIALEQNQNLKLKREAVQRAQAGYGGAKAASRPQVSAQSAYVGTGPIPSVVFPGPAGPTEVELGTPGTMTAKLSVAQPIDISRLISAGVKVADLNLHASRLELKREEQRTTLDVKQAYVGVLQAEAFKDVAQEALNAVEEHLKMARLHYDAGTAPRVDVLRAEVAVADARQRLVTAENAVELAKAALNNVLGVDVNQPVEVKSLPELSPIELSLADLLAEAERQRPELQVMDLRIEMAKRGVHLAKQGRLPSMALTGSYDWLQKTSEFGPNDLSWTVILGVSIPLSDGGATSAKVEQAHSDARSAQIGREQLRQGIALEVRQAYLSLQEAQARLLATAKSVEESREVLRLAQARYDTGVGTSVEVTDAVAAMTGARTNHVNAISDYRVALARLEAAVGVSINQDRRNSSQ